MVLDLLSMCVPPCPCLEAFPGTSSPFYSLTLSPSGAGGYFPDLWGFTTVSGQFSQCAAAALRLAEGLGSQSSGAEQEGSMSEHPCHSRADFHITEQCTAQGMLLEFQCLLCLEVSAHRVP